MSAERADIERFLRDVLAPAVYPRRVPLSIKAHHLRSEPVRFAEATSGRFGHFEVGDAWGGMWDTTWFRLAAEVPADWPDAVALVHLGGDEMVGFSAEGLVWSTSGEAVQGVHHHHREVELRHLREGPGVDFYVEAAANPIPPWHLRDWPDLAPDYEGKPLYTLRQAELAEPDREAEALHLDMKLLLETAECVPERQDEILQALGEARSLFDSGRPTGEARHLLRPHISRPSRSSHRVTAIGHAHIDSAWLWPVRETRRKCARTFANQLRLMERYPEHRFACSQAAQYQWIKDEHPALYQQIKERVAEGRWEPVGGMWVEADSNVPSGESLVRQLVHGKRFFREEFGVETAELWIPDVFGYSAALPQIAAQSGVKAIVTQKMSWNDTNVFPHTTFWWEGHDGSRILAHFPPADTYNGVFSASEIAKSRDNHKDSDVSDASLYPFGFGDGGGGPTSRMLERARRLASVDGLPQVSIGSVAGFLTSLVTDELPTWTGELYLEAHRATPTTHADVKLGNRRGEEALRAAEMWSVAAGIDRRSELDAAWKLLLFNQFHDIIPGSSIRWVYEDANSDYQQILRIAGEIISAAQDAITGPPAGGLTVFNPSSSARTEVADAGGHPAVIRAPACGWAGVSPSQELPEGWLPVTAGANQIDNGILRVTWDGDGLITSIWDHAVGREVIAAGERANLFQLHEDNPKAFDAWDVDRSYLDCVQDLVDLASVEVVELHPLRASVRLARRFGSSTIDQVMSLTAGSRRIDFSTEVDWQERHRFLKVAFPVAVHSPRATYEIQHGYIERPTTENTSWDRARFEVCAHRWADLGEPGYGVALLNDCKYGYDIRGHTMRLSLLRGPGYPDPNADRGRHRFTYSLLPHPGDFREAGVAASAESLNLPLTILGGQADRDGTVVSVDRNGVSVEAVKWSDGAAGDGVIVRICEVHGSRGPVTVTLRAGPAALTSAHRCDLLERPQEQLDLEDRCITVTLRPFELVTLLFR